MAMAIRRMRLLQYSQVYSYHSAARAVNDSSQSCDFGWIKRLALVAGSSFLGVVTMSSSLSEANMEHVSAESTEKKALDPSKWVNFKLQEITKVSHNTNLYRFSFDPDAKLGLYVASCIITRASVGTDAEGKPKYVIRPRDISVIVGCCLCDSRISQIYPTVYTPISDPEAKGYFDLMVKIYPEGKMTQHFAQLKPGDRLEVKGPIGTLQYGPNMKKHIGMIAGGTGITPMLQVIDAILKNPEDRTKVTLLYCNISPDDILLREKLDALSFSHPNFKVYYIVDKPLHGWSGGVGYISKDMILKGLPPPSEDTLILVCGPPGMMNHVSGSKAPDRSQGEVSGLLKEIGYTKDMVHKF